MSKEKIALFRRIFGIILSISIFTAGVALIWGCLCIYTSGASQLYTREIVSETFGKIAIPVYICVILTVLSIILEFCLPVEKSREKRSANPKMLVERLSEKRDISSDRIFSEKINSERKQRRNELFALFVSLGITALLFLFYALNPENFGSGAEITNSVIKSMWVLLPLLAIDFVFAVIISYRSKKSYENELELLKKLPVKKEAQKEERSAKKETNILAIKLCLILISVALLAYGFFAGGTADVLTKAINICTECIGLG